VPTRTEIAIGVWLDEDELSESFVRASGPGGQNVNKLSTAVELRLDVANSPTLPEWVKPRIATVAGSKMTAAGVLIIFSQSHRTQERNRADAKERLFEIIARAAVRQRKRRPTKPTRASREERLKQKSSRASIKKGRGRIKED
jgi:ribosome-associated protein